MTVIDHPGRLKAEARGDLAERLVPVAAELAFVVRDRGRDGIAAWMNGHGVASCPQTRALLIVVASMVDIGRTPEELLAHVTFDEHGRPLEGMTPVLPIFDGQDGPGTPYEDCGTVRAYHQHRRDGDDHARTEACGCAQAFRDARKARYAEGKAEASDAA